MSDNSFSLAQLGWKVFFNQQLTLENLEQSTPHRVTQVFRNRLVMLGEKGEFNMDLAQFSRNARMHRGRLVVDT